jgi:group I intron endonuclease
MEFDPRNKLHATSGGIYQIKNKSNGKIYIGSARRFQKRFAEHVRQLNNGTHHNRHLQASWNKWGKDKFIFEIIETVVGDKVARTLREQWHLEQHFDKWHLCYNSVKNCIQTYKGIADPDLFAEKMMALKKAFYQTERGRKALDLISKSKRGKSYIEQFGPERAAEIVKKISDYKVVEMNKPEVKENLRQIRLGKTEIEIFGVEKAKEIKEKRSKARKGRYTGKENSRFRVITDIKLISPDGDIHTSINGIKDFATEHNLSPNHLCELLHGKRKSHKGWRVIV